MSGTHSKSGFTLIEMLIVVAISAMLAAISISYSGVERDQAALSVEATEISQFILQARSLAIATYGSAVGSACGYGVAFDSSSGTYSIFAYVPNSGYLVPCPVMSSVSVAPGMGARAKYTDETWKVYPRNGITFSMSSSSALSLILFYPPDPATLLFDKSGNLMAGGPASIDLVTPDGAASRTILVNSVGQMSF
jgi:prepilin-type N-terminal cleavage/methylation domain-containing protein